MELLPDMKLASVIYVCGQDFSNPHSGLLKRHHVVCEFLGEKYKQHPRYLLVPKRPSVRLIQAGWTWVPISACHYRNKRNGQKPESHNPVARGGAALKWGILKWYGRFVHAITALTWGIFDRRPDRMLSLAGCSFLGLHHREKEFFATKPGALVLIGRCDLTGLVQVRSHEQYWALDTNDSVTNLEDVYRAADHWRRMMRISREQWLARIAKVEKQFAAQYDRVINMSREDEAFFADSAAGKMSFEDTCVVLPAQLPTCEPKFDVGYIGGVHPGSVLAASNLIDLAGRTTMGKLTFGIAGRVHAKLGDRRLPANTTLVGAVDSSLDFLRQCKCVVIFAGPETGASVKFQESLAAGCIVVANRNAARFSLAKPGETHLEVESMEEVAQLLLSGDVWRFSPKNLQAHFAPGAFQQRFATALGWP